MKVEQAIRDRLSIKEFAPRPVPRERIERLLELAILAPNHRMTQPLEFRVLGPEAKMAYAEALAARKARRLENADAARAVREKVVGGTLAVPAMIGVVMALSENPEIREEDFATAFMAIENLALAGVELGLGTHIRTGAVLGDEPVLRALQIREGQRLVALVFLGEPASVPDRKPRVSAVERTRWLD